MIALCNTARKAAPLALMDYPPTHSPRRKSVAPATRCSGCKKLPSLPPPATAHGTPHPRGRVLEPRKRPDHPRPASASEWVNPVCVPCPPPRSPAKSRAPHGTTYRSLSAFAPPVRSIAGSSAGSWPQRKACPGFRSPPRWSLPPTPRARRIFFPRPHPANRRPAASRATPPAMPTGKIKSTQTNEFS